MSIHNAHHQYHCSGNFAIVAINSEKVKNLQDKLCYFFKEQLICWCLMQFLVHLRNETHYLIFVFPKESSINQSI